MYTDQWHNIILFRQWYRPIQYTFDDRLLFETFKHALDGNNILLIMGYFNLADFRWPLHNFDAGTYTLLHGKFVDM